MSDLQLALIAVGAVVIAGVYAYNVLQERRFRKRAEAAFAPPAGDPLLQPAGGRSVEAAPTGRVEPRIGAEAAEPVSLAAVAVAPSGRFVYVSNRGHNSVGIFRVDESNGLLSAVAWEPTTGPTPRFIGLDPAGARLYAANQAGDTIVEFDVSDASGLLTATGRIMVAGTPVCVVWR